MGNFPKNINAFDLNEWFNSEDENPIIIDVREDSELEIAIFPREFLHLPISKVSVEYVKSKISNAKDKKLHQVYKGLSANVVREAFSWDENFMMLDTDTYHQAPGSASGY